MSQSSFYFILILFLEVSIQYGSTFDCTDNLKKEKKKNEKKKKRKKEKRKKEKKKRRKKEIKFEI